MSKILYLGPIRDGTGYSHMCRANIKSMLAAGMDIVTRQINLSGLEFAVEPEIEDLFKKDMNGVTHVIQHYLPSMFVRRGDVKNIGVFHWETTNFKQSGWQFSCNLMDQVNVCCDDSLLACQESGVKVPISTIPYSCDPAQYNKDYEKPEIELKNRYVFYSVADFSYRKNVKALIRAYLAEFSKRDDVVLILKTYISGISPEESVNRITAMINEIKERMRKHSVDLFPPIVLITDRMTDDQIFGLHQIGDCYVSTEYGSDWCIPAFDAVGFGNNVLAPNSGGPKHFLPSSNLITGEYQQCFGMDRESCPYYDLYTANEMWYVIQHQELRDMMRYSYENKQKIKHYTNIINEFSHIKIGEQWKKMI